MNKSIVTLLLLGLVYVAVCETYFKDSFESGLDKWVMSDWKGDSQGKFEHSAGNIVGDGFENAKGLRTTENMRFYTASAKFDKDFSNKDKTLVVQFSVKHEQKIECGGAYVKLYPGDVDQSHLHDNQQYNIMFGPDICGSSKIIQFILHHNGENHQIQKELLPAGDHVTHVYTLVLRPDNTFDINIDGEVKHSGKIDEDFNILPPKLIKDPSQSKPADWVDEEEIDDPEDIKPEGYDDIPATIPDADAKKPEDWDDELDGDWEAPQIPNPEYKGPWTAKKIKNPAYKGPWEHPMIPNPEYKENLDLYAYDSFSHIGIEVWQVKAGTVFDNFLITDSVDEANAALKSILEQRDAEIKTKEKADEEKKMKEEEERKKFEEKKDSEVPPELVEVNPDEVPEEIRAQIEKAAEEKAAEKDEL